MSGYREHLLVIALFVVLVFLFAYPFSLHLHEAVISSHVDNLLNVWIMSWDAHAVVTDPTALFQANMNYPSPDSLAYSEHLFILAMFAAPISWVTGNPVLAYNLVALLGFALCGYAMYLLARYLTGSRLAAFAAGVFFAFVPYHFSTIVHVHVSLYLFQPLIILMLFRYFDVGERRYLLGLGAAFLAQALLGWYQLAFSSIPIGLFLLWKTLSPRWREHLGALLRVVGVLALCMLVILPFALPYFRLHKNIPEKEGEPAINVIAHATARDYVRVLPQNWLYGKLGFLPTGNPGEGNALFPGFLVFPLLVLALFSALKGARTRGKGSAEASRSHEELDFPANHGTSDPPAWSGGAEESGGLGTPMANGMEGRGAPGPETGGNGPSAPASPPRAFHDPCSGHGEPGVAGFDVARGLRNEVTSSGESVSSHQGLDTGYHDGTGERTSHHIHEGGPFNEGHVKLLTSASRRAYFVYFAALGLTCFVLSLGPEPHGIPNPLYKALHKLPIYGFVRFPTRYHIMVILSLSVMVAYGCSHLQDILERKRGRSWANATVAAVTALVLLEFLVVSLPYSAVAVGDAVPRVYRDLADVEGAVVAEVPMPAVGNSVVFEDPLTINYGTLDNTFLSALREQDATYFSIYNWKKLLNGMSGYYPLFYRRALVETLSFPSSRSLHFLRGAGVNHLVVQWERYPPEMQSEVREKLDKSPGVTLVEDYPEGQSLYRLEPLETAPATDLDIQLAAPGLAGPGQHLSSSLVLSNPSSRPFLNLDEKRQPVEASWRDGKGEVVRRESSYFYCPFFIAGEEGALAPFELTAPVAAGEYTLELTVKEGALEGRSWETRVMVDDFLDVESESDIRGALEAAWGALSSSKPEESGPGGAPSSPAEEASDSGEATSLPASITNPAGGAFSRGPAVDETPLEGISAADLSSGECFSLTVVVHNGGAALWEREREGVVGTVAVTARWTREGDAAWEMVQQGSLPCDLAPDQEAIFPIPLQAPVEEGEYSLTLRLNCLGITYIGEPLTLSIKVTRQANTTHVIRADSNTQPL
ncbi:MAG: hypothetical protein HPY75_00310 [Actinobacteria bacterium]|nr:hypothetical protein [Actinomycetota bacterium]